MEEETKPLLVVDDDEDSLDEVIEEIYSDFGWVYILCVGKYYKIGYTKAENPNDRIDNYKTHNPHEIRLIGARYVCDPRAVEKRLHTEFQTKRHRPNREWFILNREDIKTALRIMDNVQ